MTTNVSLFVHKKIEVMFPQGSLNEVQEGTKLLAILDENWEEFLREERCMIRDRLNRWIVPLDTGEADDGDAYFRTSIRQVRDCLLHHCYISARICCCCCCCRYR